MEHIYKAIIEQVLKEFMCDGGELEKASYRWVLRLCRESTHVDVEVVDVGYDVSTYPRRSSRPIDYSQFDTVQDFFDMYTGNTIATFCSGSGFAAETFEDIFQEFVRDYIYDWITHLPLAEKVFIDGEWDDDFMDYLCDSDANEIYFVPEFALKPFPRMSLVK